MSFVITILSGMNTIGVVITQPDPLINIWTEFWNATSGMLLFISVTKENAID